MPAPPLLKDIVFVGVDPGVQDQIRNQLQLRSGDPLTPEAVIAAINALHGIDEHMMLAVMSRKKADGTVSEANVRITVRPDVNQTPPALPLATGRRNTDGSPAPLRVGGNVQAVNLINKVTPMYPPLAKQARIQGTVRFNATIATDGTVKNLELVSGHPLLAAAATEAVKQWVYRPTLLNGQPVEVETQIDVNFTLSE
jgi:TonB family protein